jgi:Protein kinase domain/zinc-ribbon domain
MAYCSHCGSGLPATARFCSSCGEPNASGAEAEVQVTLDRSPSSPVPPSPSSSQGRSSGSGLRAESGRILPGTLLADRYRIVALVGRGGMGEVYRAEDLKLDQDVALKFLPEKLVQDGAALARFHREVRIAREISHPNVCRVFDIGEANGVPFISMEYVDGEDLSTLLRRIGRLGQDKAVEIARQLCAGIEVAHDHGVLHRDLKPANVMLDDRGRVRIMDFGLAGIATEIQGAEISSGTPAYMAPEQLAGKEVTIRSDIYSLGLVLYELFTAKRPFEAATVAEMIRLREQSYPSRPSSMVRDLDPLVERVIMRCLDVDPQKRPATALQVAAALPGGDPLQAALAAGETPSPQMVAAAGGEQALAARVAWSLLAAVLVIFVAVLWVAKYSTDLGLYPINKSPEVLEDRAAEIASQFGYSQVADKAWWFERNYAYLLYRNAMKMSSPHGQPIAGSNPGALSFVYRQSPEPMTPNNSGGRMQWFDPPPLVSGMAIVDLDSLGRLRSFYGIPRQDEIPIPALEPKWQDLFQAAGLEISRFKSAPPRWLPPEPFDVQRGWEGTYAGDSTPIRVLAASHHGKPVLFRVMPPWIDQPELVPTSHVGGRRVAYLLIVAVGGTLLALIGLFLARKNIRLGRGDREGAFRLAAWYFLVNYLARILLAHHVAKFDDEYTILTDQVALALFFSAVIWVYYMALEPYVRRSWPEYLISWTRLLHWDYRNPMVGRDVLAGSVAGALLALVSHIVNGLPAWFNLAGQTPINANGLALGPVHRFVGGILFFLLIPIISGLSMLFLFFILRTVTKRYWIAVMLFGVLNAILLAGTENVIAEGTAAVISAALISIVLLRFGLLGLVAAYTVQDFMSGFPVALDPSRWYFARGLVPVLIVLALALYGFRTSLGKQPVFAALTAEE